MTTAPVIIVAMAIKRSMITGNHIFACIQLQVIRSHSSPINAMHVLVHEHMLY